MMIGGGSRGKDRGQWDGWRLEETSKRPASIVSKPRLVIFITIFTITIYIIYLFI